MMVARQRQRAWRKSGLGDRTARLLAFLLFAAYVGYIPFHLGAELHFYGSLGHPAAAVEADAHHDHDEDGHDHDHHHTPHPASDHDIPILPKSESVFFSLVFLPTVSLLVIEAPQPQPPIPVFERIKPPGVSPPDPLQPRAPPLA